jgi:hypothetical protein
VSIIKQNVYIRIVLFGIERIGLRLFGIRVKIAAIISRLIDNVRAVRPNLGVYMVPPFLKMCRIRTTVKVRPAFWSFGLMAWTNVNRRG